MRGPVSTISSTSTICSSRSVRRPTTSTASRPSVIISNPVCREEYPAPARIALWLMAEVALIGVDIHELIGSAIEIKILSRGVLLLWVGVVITALDWKCCIPIQMKKLLKLWRVIMALIRKKATEKQTKDPLRAY